MIWRQLMTNQQYGIDDETNILKNSFKLQQMRKFEKQKHELHQHELEGTKAKQEIEANKLAAELKLVDEIQIQTTKIKRCLNK